ncbi:hypothetical protein V8C35DRAFT_309318 [Trichoderma chlorosporum]
MGKKSPKKRQDSITTAAKIGSAGPGHFPLGLAPVAGGIAMQLHLHAPKLPMTSADRDKTPASVCHTTANSNRTSCATPDRLTSAPSLDACLWHLLSSVRALFFHVVSTAGGVHDASQLSSDNPSSNATPVSVAIPPRISLFPTRKRTQPESLFALLGSSEEKIPVKGGVGSIIQHSQNQQLGRSSEEITTATVDRLHLDGTGPSVRGNGTTRPDFVVPFLS